MREESTPREAENGVTKLLRVALMAVYRVTLSTGLEPTRGTGLWPVIVAPLASTAGP